jgi:hypothetical protein
MSFMRLLERMFEPARETDRIAREQRQDVQGPLQQDGKDHRFRCKACGLESTEGSYCPECLADTMVLIDRRRGP